MDKREVRLIDYGNKSILVNNINSNGQSSYGIDMINAKKMWDLGYKGKNITIAVIDTGCDTSHKNLSGRIIGGRNFTSEDNGNVNIYKDYNGHGTHVAGIIAAEPDSENIIGVAPQAELLILKVLNKNGSGSLDSVIKAINYAVDKKVDIISMSLGTKNPIRELENSIIKANDKKILVVCAAGNEGDNNKDTNEFSYPGAYNEVINVGAVDSKKSAALFTNSNKEVDVVAPGVGILSTWPNNRYAILSGTSMSTPFVTGALALLIEWSIFEFGRRLSEVELYGQLIKNTTKLNMARTFQGNGLVYLNVE